MERHQENMIEELQTWTERSWDTLCVSVFSPGSGLGVVMSRVAHGAELGHKEVVAAVVGRRVLLNVGKLHELERRQEVKGNSCERRVPNNQSQV